MITGDGNATVNGTTLRIEAMAPDDTHEIEVAIESSRNKPMSRLSDVSDRDPEREKLLSSDRQVDASGKICDIFYPVVDVEIEHGMTGLVLFAGTKDADCAVNGASFNDPPKPIDERLSIAADRLLFWENSVYVRSSEPIESAWFTLQKRYRLLPATNRRFVHAYRLLSLQWAGVITVHALDAQGTRTQIAELIVEEARPQPDASRSPGRDDHRGKDALLEALGGALDYVVESQVRDRESLSHGGFYLFYDLDAATYRLPIWIWSWGPAIGLLSNSALLDGLPGRHQPERLKQIASDAVQASLRYVIINPDHETHGFGCTRWDHIFHDELIPDTNGLREAINCGSDSGFLAGWGWAPVYEATRDEEILQTYKLLAESTDKLMGKFRVIPQEWMPDWDTWKPSTNFESGFGMQGFDEFYRITGDSYYRTIGTRFIEQHIETLERPDGLWNNMYYHETQTIKPCDFSTRGIGWALMALQAAYRLTEDEKYLEKCRAMAEHLLDSQDKGGAWGYYFRSPLDQVGADDKGTPMWSMLLYRLASMTDDDRYRESASRALDWCLENQYDGPDLHARGSLVSCNARSAIIYRNWFNVSCLYGAAFFGLALLEALRAEA